MPERVPTDPLAGEQSLADEKVYLEKSRGLQLESLKQDIEARKAYARKLFYLILWWLVSVLAVLLLAGWKPCSFTLSDPVLLALIGGTTVNVLGLFLVVAKYLFPEKK